jgi:hypothetical protein
MRFWRGAGAAGAWSLATGLGAVIVWLGLQPVLDAAVPDRSAALSAADLRRMATPTGVPALAPDLPSLPPPSAGPSSSPAGPPAHPATPSPTGNHLPAPAASVSVVDGWTVTTRSDGSVTYVRSFHVTGGDAVIGMTPGHVYLISAAPRSPYTVVTSQPQPVRLVVQFINGSRANLVDAIWWNNAPYSQVT